MASALPEDIKKRAEKKCADNPNLVIQDPGTVYTTSDGRVFVFVVDKASHSPLWIEM
jgi:hypothetical protein